MVVAYDENRAIGRDGGLLWEIKDLKRDMQRFKALTVDSTVIMGRKTLESIGRALPNRRNIVITSSEPNIAEVEYVQSLQEALELCSDQEEAFVIGGASVYEQALPYTQRVLATEVLHRFSNPDTFFPKLDDSWHISEVRNFVVNDDNIYPMRFVTYER